MPSKRTLTVVTCATGTLTGQLNITGLNIVLPAIRDDLHLTGTQTHWLATVYVLVLAGLVMVAGALGDRFDKRRVLIGALTVYLAGSVLACVSWGPAPLLAGRALSAAGGCALVPIGLAVLRAVAATPAQLASYMSAWGMAIGVGMALGPVIAGVAVLASWRAFFAVMVLLGAAYLAGVIAFVPRTRDNPATRVLSLDYLLMAVWMGCGTAALIELSADTAWAYKLILGVGSAAVFACWLVYERRSPRAALPREALSSRSFTVSIGMALCNYLGLGAALFAFALCLQDRLGVPASVAGLLNVPLAATIAFGSQWSGRALGTRGPAFIMRVSAVAIAVGAAVSVGGAALHAEGPHGSGVAVTGTAILVAGTAVSGFGFGAANTPVNVLTMSALPSGASGAAGSSASAARQLGQSFGTALAGVLIAAGGAHAVSRQAGLASAAPDAGYLLAAGVVALAAAVMFVLPVLYPRGEQ